MRTILLLFFYSNLWINSFSQDCKLDSLYHIDVLKDDTLNTEYFKGDLLIKRKKHFMKAWGFDIEENYYYTDDILHKREDRYIQLDGEIEIDSFIYTYEKEQLVKEHEYRKDGSPFANEFITVYNYIGDTIKISKSYPFGTSERYTVVNLDGTKMWYNDTKSPSVRKYIDASGNVISLEKRKENKWYVYSRFEYKYDQCKNIIDKIEKKHNGEILTREAYINFYNQ